MIFLRITFIYKFLIKSSNETQNNQNESFMKFKSNNKKTSMPRVDSKILNSNHLKI